MAKQKKEKKSKYDVIPGDFRDTTLSKSREELKELAATVALAQAELMNAKSKDEDLKEAKARAKEAGAIYREGTQINKAKIDFIKECLDAKGG